LKLLGKIPSAMAEMGWDVHVVAGDTASEVPATLSGIRLHTLSMVRNPSPLKDIYSVVSWMLLLRRVKPSIVVIGTPKAALLGLIASFACRVPVRVYQLRGLRLQTVSGLASHVLFLMEWITAKSSTTILAVSKSLKDEYCRVGLGESKKIKVLGFGSSHGVDVHYFHPTRWSSWEPHEPKLRQARTAGIPVLGFVGRFSKDKGAQELLQCCKVLGESGIRHAVLVIGPLEGEEESLNDLMRLCPGTIVTGPVADVAPYYSIMDILLLPTHREGFPNAVLEAAASGVPTVTTAATGAIDSVIDSQTGLVVPHHDGEALAKAVILLVSNPELAKEFGSNARARTIAQFDDNVVSKNYVEYLTQIARSAGMT
jgi:glycosyltransferase involved in cell wall biosynthesis